VHCSEFTEINDCENSSIGIAIASIETNPDYGVNYCFNVLQDETWRDGSLFCWNQTACECAWNGTACLGEARIEKECNDTSKETFKSCDYQITYDDSACETGGQINATWTLIAGPADCTEGSYWIPCTDIMRLFFFTIINVIVVIVILVVIYYIYIKRKKSKKVFKKKKK